MKKLLYVIPIGAALLGASCTEEFLDRKNLYEESDENYYRNPQQIASALAGAYAALPAPGRGDEHPIFIANARADYAFGGGDPTDFTMHDLDGFNNQRGNDAFDEPWEQAYRGIFRTNMIIARFDQADYGNNLAQRGQDLGEAHFLRAFFYFRLAQMFERVPLIIEPVPVNYPQAEPAALYAQIAADLKKAIEVMPATPFNQIPASRLGHATRWAAQALMARVFLFYTGFYQADALPLPDGGQVTRQQVIDWLEDCIDNSGHGLVADFRNLWAYSYSPNPEYPFVVNNNLSWVGEEGANNEAMFMVKYSVLGAHPPDGVLQYSNQLVLYSSLRDLDVLPWGQGWGGTPVNSQLWENWPANDPRRQGTILNALDPVEGQISQLFDLDDVTGMHQTGFFQKKYHNILARNAEGQLRGIFSILYNPALTNFQLHNAHDEIIIRFADVLLMAAELGGPRAQAHFDRVRARAGLAPVALTPENIQNERKWELAFEGLRYYDLLRWGIAEQAFAQVANVPVSNAGTPALHSTPFRRDRAFLPIPESQIQLSGGVLKQHPGWLGE